MESTEGWREAEINPVIIKQYNSKIAMGARAGVWKKWNVHRKLSDQLVNH